MSSKGKTHSNGMNNHIILGKFHPFCCSDNHTLMPTLMLWLTQKWTSLIPSSLNKLSLSLPLNSQTVSFTDFSLILKSFILFQRMRNVTRIILLKSFSTFFLHKRNLEIFFCRPENREKYTRSKSPSNFNRKTIEVSTPAVSKTSVPASRPQRPRTASMPAENRKVKNWNGKQSWLVYRRLLLSFISNWWLKFRQKVDV